MEFILIWILVIIAVIVLQILTLIRQAKKKEWAWFVLSLLFTPVWIIYWIVKLIKGDL